MVNGDIPLWAALLVGIVTAGATTAFTLLVDSRRYEAARRERLEHWRFEASKNYMQAVLNAFRTIETTAKWIQAGTHAADVPSKVEQGRVARESRWFAYSELLITCAPGLNEWFHLHYSPAEENVERAFHDAYHSDGSDYSAFWSAAKEWRAAFDRLTLRLRDEMRTKVD